MSVQGPAVTRRAIACCLLLVQRLLTCRDERARSELLDNQVDQLADLVAALSGHLNILEVESSMDSTGDADTCEPDLAAIQLEALNALLHIFPLPSPGGRVEAVLRASADGQQWPRSTRAGVHTLLVARVGLVQRHAALTLAAAMVELLGPGWLVGEGRQGADRDAFFQALVEVVKVSFALQGQPLRLVNQTG